MKKKVRVAALSVALLAVAVSAYRLWEIYAGYHQADQVYQDTAAQVIHTESAGLLRTRLHGLGKSRNGLPPFLWILLPCSRKIRMWWDGFTAPVP